MFEGFGPSLCSFLPARFGPPVRGSPGEGAAQHLQRGGAAARGPRLERPGMRRKRCCQVHTRSPEIPALSIKANSLAVCQNSGLRLLRFQYGLSRNWAEAFSSGSLFAISAAPSLGSHRPLGHGRSFWAQDAAHAWQALKLLGNEAFGAGQLRLGPCVRGLSRSRES